MGGLGALAGMMPGMKKAKAAMASSRAWTTRCCVRMDAIIGSMTPKERATPRICSTPSARSASPTGRGTQVQDVNKLLKMHQEMARAMKQIKKMGGLKGLAAMFGGGGGGADGRHGRRRAAAAAGGRRSCRGLAARSGRPPAQSTSLLKK